MSYSVLTSALFGCVSRLRRRPLILVGLLLTLLLPVALSFAAAVKGHPAASLAPPAAPTNANLYTYPAPNAIKIYWTDGSTDESSFTVERKVDGQPDSAFFAIGSSDPVDVPGTGGRVYFEDDDLQPDTTFDYRVKAVNAAGSSDYSNTTSGTTAPVAPIHLTAAATAGFDNKITLTFTDNAHHTTAFGIFRQGPNDQGFNRITNQTLTPGFGSTETYTDSGLNTTETQGSTYQYYVIAYNDAGESGPSNTANATTNPTLSAPAAPSGVGGYVGSTGADGKAAPGTTFRAYFYDESTNEDSFTLERKSEDQSTWTTIATDPASFGTGHFYDYYDTGLAVDTQYSYRVTAHNSKGDTLGTSVLTDSTVPVAASGLTAVPVSDSKVTLSFTDNARHSFAFGIYRKLHTDPDTAWARVANQTLTPGKGNAETYTVGGLNVATQYDFYVTAYNDAGESPASNTATATTTATSDPPAAPSGVGGYVGSTGADGRAAPGTTFRAYFYDESTNEDDFTLERQTEGQTAWAVIATDPGSPGTGHFYDYYDTGLAVDTQYSYRVVAHNSAGDTVGGSILTDSTVPVAASGLTAVPVSDSKVTLSFTDNARHSFAFGIYRKLHTDPDTAWARVANQTLTPGKGNAETYTVGGLNVATQYDFYVTAYNDAGESPASNTATATTTATSDPPAAPSGVGGYVGSTGADGRAAPGTTFRAYFYDESTNEDDFTLERQTEGQTAWAVIATDPGSPGTGHFYDYYDTGLAVDTKYSYRVTAHNSKGDTLGDSVLTDATVPVAPVNLAATAISDTKITLTFNDNANHSFAFGVYRKLHSDDATHWVRVTNQTLTPGKGNAETYTDTGLTPETQYDYYVVAYNNAGDSDPSNTATATSFPTNPPGAPSDLRAQATIQPTQVELNWLDNSSDESGFIVERQAEGETIPTALPPTPTVGPSNGIGARVFYNDTSVAADTTYTYDVYATNPAGNSAKSSAVTVTTVPVSPSSLTATPVAGTSDQIALAWTDNSRHENGFNLYRKGPKDTTFTLLTFAGPVAGTSNTVTLTDKGLTTGATYSYYVTAYNGGGESAASNTATATTNTHDTTPPTTFIVTGPASGETVCPANAVLTLSGTDPDNATNTLSYEYKVDTGTYSAPSSSTTISLSGLSDGAHTVTVAAVDPAGNVDPNPPSRTFTIDSVAPAISAVSAAPGANSAVITWTTDKASSSLVEYRVTGTTAWTATPVDNTKVTTHSVTVNGLTPGTGYDYRVHSADACNEAISSVQTFTTTADTTPPSTSVTGGPASGATVCDNTVSFTVSGTDNLTTTANLRYEYKVDTGTYSAPSKSTLITLTGLSDGPHTITIAAVDEAGNVDPNPPVISFQVSKNPPAISALTATPTNTGATITWTTDRPTSSQVEYRPTGTTAWTATPVNSSPVTAHSVLLTGLTPGQGYDYRVHSADACHETVSGVQTFTTTTAADSTPPSTTIVSGPVGGTVCAATATFVLTGSDPDNAASTLRYEYKLDAATVYTTPSSNTTVTLTGLADGAHTVTFAAVDPSGNVDPNAAAVPFTVSLNPPAISAIKATPKDTSVTITWTTDKTSSSRVEYGTTTGYGTLTPADNTLLTSHSVTVTGLSPLTAYHFRVHSADACHEAISADGTFTTTAPLLPNLVVTALTVPTPVKPHDTVAVNWTVQNSGVGDTSTAWNDAVYLSSTPTLNVGAPGTTLLGTFPAPNGLPSGDSYSQSQNIQIPSLAPGSYYLIVQADSGNTVKESSETDNATATPLVILKVQTLIATPSSNALTLHVGTSLQGQIDLGNLGDTPLTGITATATGAPSNITITVVPPAQLAPTSDALASVTVLASNASNLSGTATLTFTTKEGQTTTATLNLSVVPPKPNLVLSSALLLNGTLTAGMVRGDQTLVQATVTNTGDATATGLRVSLPPNQPFLSLTTPAAIGDLGPGQTAAVVLSLMPSAIQPLGLYHGLIAVNGTNAAIPINYAFDCISSAFGSLKVISQDEFSYFATPPQPLTGAAVTLTDAATGAVVLTGTTDAQGNFSQANIREGSYNLMVTSPQHSTYRNGVRINASRETDVAAFLSRQLVTYQWSVVPVDLQDHYAVTLQAVFQTNVPAPVVTVSPALVDLNKVQFDKNGQAVVYLTVTNHGLIAADDTRLNLPARPDYLLTTPVADLGKLAALTTIIVPVTVTNTALAPMGVTAHAVQIAVAHGQPGTAQLAAGLAGGAKGHAAPHIGALGCNIEASINWDYFCGGPREQESPIDFTISGCPSIGGGGPGGIPPPIGGDFGGGDFGGGFDGGFDAFGGGDPPALDLGILCDPCFRARLQTIYDCYNTISETKECTENVVKVAETCPEAETGITAIPCVYYLYETITSCYTAIKDIVNCIQSVLDSCKGIGSSAQSKAATSKAASSKALKPADTGTPDTPDITNLRTSEARLRAHLDFLQVFLGDPKWTQVPAAESPVEQTLVTAIAAAMNPSSDGGLQITPAELTTLLALPRPSTITAADVTEVANRWNRTLTYYGENIFYANQVPAGGSTDFITADVMDAAKAAAVDAAKANIADGYTGIFDGPNAAVQTVQNNILDPAQAGTCAKVKIELDQTVAITRTAFKATLELDNAPQNSDLTNVKVSLKVTDAAGNDATSLFGITTPTVSGFNDDGSLPSGQNGTDQWTITPTHDAAANGTTQYFVTGQVSYDQSGSTITIPLFPTGITVKPDPFLKLHYFLTKQIYSDDPFTPQIEPAEPFSLGLLVTNTGMGTAHNFDITSSQPKIVDNEKGLLINFDLIGTQLNTDPISPSLEINFGDIGPGQTGDAQFILTTSLSGQFISSDATFKHTDDLGNPKTSLIDTVDTHSLEHVVRVVDPTDDGKPDFLADDQPDSNNLPDTVWNSDGTTAQVTPFTNATGDIGAKAPIVTDGMVSNANLVIHLTATVPATGFIYLRTDDPGQGNFQLLRVVRSDGKEILVGPNAWTTNRTLHLADNTNPVQKRFYLFDANSTGQYTLIYGQAAPVGRALGGLKALGDGTKVVFGQPASSGTGTGGTGSGGTGQTPGGIATPSGQTVVTAVFPDGMYVEALDRSSGIKVVPASAHVGDIVTGSGVIGTDADGERYIQASSVIVTGAGRVDPLAFTDKALYGGDYLYSSSTGGGQRGMDGGAGLNAVGLEVATIGRVTASDGSGALRMDDGYGRPVKVLLPTGVTAPAVGSFAGLAGVVSCAPSAVTAGALEPVLRMRTPDDLVTDLRGLADTFIAPARTLAAGRNVFSLPGLPANPAPPSVLSGLNLADLTGNLSRYDTTAQAEALFDPALDPFSLLNGEGYRVQLSPAQAVAVAGLSFPGYHLDFADRWLSLPKLGATRLGDPFGFPVDWASVLVTDGDKTVTLTDAARTEFPAWLQSKAAYRDNAGQADRTLGLPDDTPTPDSTQLTPWQGYFVLSQRDDLALMVPHSHAPVLQAISPSTAQAGGPAFTLTVTGTGFVSGAAVNWNGAARPTTFLSATQLTAQVTAADIAAAGTAQVTVTTPGGTSAALTFTITPTNPVPAITTLSPTSATVGGSDFTLTVTGTGFVSGAAVNWNGTARPTTFLSATQLTAQVTAADIAAAGTAQVTVTNPAPGGGMSPAVPFLIASGTATDITSQVKVTGTGLSYNPIKHTYTGTVTVTNLGTAPISGPIQLVLTGLPAGITLTNATGTVGGSPYLTVTAAALAPGASGAATVTVKFSRTGTAGVSYTPVVYSGTF